MDGSDKPIDFSYWVSRPLDLFAPANRTKCLPFLVSASLHAVRVRNGPLCYTSNQARGREDRLFSPLDIFRVCGTVTLPQTICDLRTRGGERTPIVKYEIWLSATNSVKIISPSQGTSNGEANEGPPSILLDWSSYKTSESDETRVPFTWQGLQFEMPPEESGKCRMEHFFVRLQVVATFLVGGQIIIAQVNAGPITIQDSKERDVIPGKGSSCRKDVILSPAKDDKLPKTTKTVAIPSHLASKQFLSAARDLSSPATGCQWHNQGKVPTNSGALRESRWRPYSSRSHIRQRTVLPNRSTSHPLRTTSFATSP